MSQLGAQANLPTLPKEGMRRLLFSVEVLLTFVLRRFEHFVLRFQARGVASPPSSTNSPIQSPQRCPTRFGGASNCIVITYRQANKPTAALEYKSARKDMKNGEHRLVHLWELGGGSQLCSLLECALKKVHTPRSCSQLCLHRTDLVVALLGRRRLFLGPCASSLST